MDVEIVESPEIVKVNSESSVLQSSKKEDKPTREANSEKKNPINRQTRSQTRKSSKADVPINEKSAGGAGIESIDVDSKDNGTKKKSTARRRKRKRGDVTYLPRINNASSVEGTWNERDKQRLLLALQRYGILEMDQLLKAVPGKSEGEIRNFIHVKWRSAREELKAHLKEVRKSMGDKSKYLGPVDNWLEVLNTLFPNTDHYKTNPLASAVLLIWKFEKHPDPSECRGVDFKALYEHMYYMLCGYPAKHLNQPTASFLAESLKRFACHMKSGNWTAMQDFLSRPLIVNSQAPPSISEDDVITALSFTKEECLEKLSKMSGFNPFSIPLNLLQCQATSSKQTEVAAASSADVISNANTNSELCMSEASNK